MRLTVLYDDRCPMCRAFGTWLARQPLLVPLRLVPAGSARARQRFPMLDHARTLEEVTVVSDAGAVWTGAHAWVMCLWATAAHLTAGIRNATSSLPGRPRTSEPCQDARCAPRPVASTP